MTANPYLINYYILFKENNVLILKRLNTNPLNAENLLYNLVSKNLKWFYCAAEINALSIDYFKENVIPSLLYVL